MGDPQKDNREPGGPDDEAAKDQINVALERPEHKVPKADNGRDHPVPDDA